MRAVVHWSEHLLLVVCALPLLALSAFPNSSSPVTLNPAVEVRGQYCGSSTLFQNVKLRSATEIQYSSFSGCPCLSVQHLSGVVLDVEGTVQGTQFDRYGALWVGGVEVLRTSTPEPTPAGIRWSISRDLTAYKSLFLQPQNVSLSIPNTISGPYNGVLILNVSVRFYQDEKASSQVEVLGVLDRAAILEQPWTTTAVDGGKWQNTSLPRIPARTESLFLDLFASGHECEEFEAGYDCGGPVRRLRVHVDDHPAGVMHPFPVIYTGGVNPLLWRPLTGIASFDIPPYRFDLTPLLPLLLDGGEHLLSLAVDHGTTTGVWYLDPVLLCVLGSEAPSGGMLHKANLTSSYLLQNVSSNTVVGKEVSEFVLQGVLNFSKGSREIEVRGRLDAWANYTTVGGGGGPTTPPDHRRVLGQSSGTIHTAQLDSWGGGNHQDVSFRFPYQVNLSQTQNGDAFNIHANVSYGREGSLMSSAGRTMWSHQILAGAVYQRNQDRVMVAADNNATEKYLIEESEMGICFDKLLTAVNGSIVSNAGQTSRCDKHSLAAAGGPLPSLSLSDWVQ